MHQDVSCLVRDIRHPIPKHFNIPKWSRKLLSSLKSNPMYCLNGVVGGGDNRSHKLASICGTCMLAERYIF